MSKLISLIDRNLSQYETNNILSERVSHPNRRISKRMGKQPDEDYIDTRLRTLGNKIYRAEKKNQNRVDGGIRSAETRKKRQKQAEREAEKRGYEQAQEDLRKQQEEKNRLVAERRKETMEKNRLKKEQEEIERIRKEEIEKNQKDIEERKQESKRREAQKDSEDRQKEYERAMGAAADREVRIDDPKKDSLTKYIKMDFKSWL